MLSFGNVSLVNVENPFWKDKNKKIIFKMRLTKASALGKISNRSYAPEYRAS
jgi:hypothetical protein